MTTAHAQTTPAPGNSPASSSTARKILWNTVAQIIGKAFIASIGVIIIKLITNYLGAAGYGQYTTTFDFLALFSIVADLGLYTIGVREMANDQSKIPMIMGNMLSLRTIMAILVICAAGFIAPFIASYQGTHIPIAVWLAGIATLFSLLTTIVSAVLQVHLKMQYNSLASSIGKVANLAYIIFVIFILSPHNKDMGFYQLVVAGIIGNLIMLVLTYIYSRKYTPIVFRFDKIFIKDVVLKALPYGIALILNTVYFYIGSFTLSIFRGQSEWGAYGVPLRVIQAIGIIPLYFMNAVLPVLTRALARKDGSQQKIIQYAFDFLIMGSMPIVAGTFVLSTPIISLISSPEFLSNPAQGIYGSDAALPILIFALAFSFISSLFGFILVAANQQMKILTRNAFGAAMTVILDFMLVPKYGIRAAAAANVLTECYVAVSSYLIAKHYAKFTIDLKNTYKMALSAVVMGIVVWVLEPLLSARLQDRSIFILIPIGIFVYVGMLIVTKTISKDMLELLRKPKPLTASEQKVIPEQDGLET